MTDSNKNDARQVACPNCAKALVADGVKPSDLVRCAACGETFFEDTSQFDAARRKAMFSLLFGIATPCCFLTAIPGLLYGIAALRETQQYSQVQSRRWMAFVGITLSLGFGLTCAGSFGLTGLIGLTQRIVRESEEVFALAHESVDFELPADFEGQMGMQIMGSETYIFKAEPRNAEVMMQLMANTQAGMDANSTTLMTLKRPYRGEVEEEVVLMTEPSEVIRQRLIHEGGHVQTRYLTVIQEKHRILSVVMTINEAGADSERIPQAEMLAFFRSLKLR